MSGEVGDGSMDAGSRSESYAEDESPEPGEPAKLSPEPELYEDIEPAETAVAKSAKGPDIWSLRQGTILGIGFLLFFGITLGFVLVIVNPALQEFAKSFLQLIVGGLIGLGGSVVGFLFAGTKDH